MRRRAGRHNRDHCGFAEAEPIYHRAMRRLRVCIAALTALLLAAVARAVTVGLNATGRVALALTALLLLASLGLWRQGSRLR
jgi:hypothetical protein